MMIRSGSGRLKDEVMRLSRDGLDWVTFSSEANDLIRRAVPFSRSCWHTVDPGTVLLTGSLNEHLSCSGSWLAEHEYVLEDVNKWWFLARSGRYAGATSLATYGDLSRSARHRSHATLGIGDELRGAMVVDGTYWGAVGFLREADEPWFTQDDVSLLAALSRPLAEGLRRALLVDSAPAHAPLIGPGVVVFTADGQVESVSPAAERWIDELVEEPAPSAPGESKAVRAVAAAARTLRHGQDPLELSARARARTRSGSWVLLYGTPLGGNTTGRTAVIIQPASPNEVAPLVALAYGLTDREIEVTTLCLRGQSTKEMARTLRLSAYTVQDHLKSIFDKTGTRSRGELVGRVFLEHVVPRWEIVPTTPPGWTGLHSGGG